MPAVARPTPEERGYGYRHRQERERLKPIVLAGGVRCVRCGDEIEPGEPWDLGHIDGDKQKYSGPEHRRCNRATAARRPWAVVPVELEPERDGIPASDPRWRVPWLKDLVHVPADATWPRLMTVPHERAVGSLGAEFIDWAERHGTQRRPLRWWQRLAATRLLEVDSSGRLVWETLVLSMARQLGKSWLLRELCLWRIQQGAHFGEPQDVLHTGKDVAICKEVQRPARYWAKARAEYRVREVNGQEEIEFLLDGSRWMLRAKEAVYGYAVSVGAVDEAWKVRAASVDEGLTPTMAEREQAQLWLVSTAHRLATSLMLGRRQTALADLESGDGDLLVEWSAPHGSVLDNRDVWRLASPHWTPQRERLIRKRYEAMQSGEVADPDEPDPEESFRAQWLNEWPRVRAVEPGKTEPLLPEGLWLSLQDRDLTSFGPVFVALEDDYGMGAAVCAVARLDDGRLELDGWLRDDWDTAIRDVQQLAAYRRIREFHVGASLLDRLPMDGSLPRARPAAGGQTRVGLALFRDLAQGRQLAHEGKQDLNQAITQAKVREALSGLLLASQGPTHLVRATVWALQAAHKPVPVPAIR